LGQFQVLLRLFQDEARRELWDFMGVAALDFDALSLPWDASDEHVWNACQAEQVVLVTANRNADRPDSLEAVPRRLNQSNSLPVFPCADPQRILRDRHYAEETADRLLEYLFDIDCVRGVGRLYIP
jgi:hypothetical protein